MVITVSSIHESVDDIFHDVEIFTMETCHEIDMITLQSRFLNEAEKGEKPDGKIKQLVNAIINFFSDFKKNFIFLLPIGVY